MTEPLEIAAVQLRVPDLSRSIDYYSRRLGFVVSTHSRHEAKLAVSAQTPPLLTLTEETSAPRSSHDAAGLFHAALLLPNRAALGAWLAATAAHGVEFEGLSDHGVSEAIYLSDPDGNGLEFYADRPRDRWPIENSELAMTTKPLNLHGLLADAATASTEPLAGARWGHLHLRVTDLERSEGFYRSTLGLETTQRSFPGARFLAANGYHHHVGLNVWGSPRAPRSSTAQGLVEATFVRPEIAEPTVLTDPDGIRIRVQPA